MIKIVRKDFKFMALQWYILLISQNNTKKKDEDEDLFDVRVLKGIPDYTDVPQYRDLAAYLQRDILVENPNVKFSDIVGLEDAKRLLK